ncbi:MAG: hypothetical protein K6G87_13000 [Butyrivibrio sp.]|nr:hypothetical protein [Butyrivibrio sp.]
MNLMKNIEIKLSFGSVNIQVMDIGSDKCVTVKGGDSPHIGCIVLAIPRPSLTGDGSISSTTSVINVTGHKDDMICKIIAEKVCNRYNCVVTCTGGIHIDNITPDQIEELFDKISKTVI